jgi:hypothetical protein
MLLYLPFDFSMKQIWNTKAIQLRGSLSRLVFKINKKKKDTDYFYKESSISFYLSFYYFSLSSKIKKQIKIMLALL